MKAPYKPNENDAQYVIFRRTEKLRLSVLDVQDVFAKNNSWNKFLYYMCKIKKHHHSNNFIFIQKKNCKFMLQPWRKSEKTMQKTCIISEKC